MAQYFDGADWLTGANAFTLGGGFGCRHTVSVWFYTDTLIGRHTLTDRGGDFIGFHYASGSIINGNQLACHRELSLLGVDDWIYATQPLVAGTWYHCLAMMDRNFGAIYLNGGNLATSVVAVDPQHQDRFRIGEAADNTRNWRHQGGMAELAIWSDYRNAGEIARLANGESPIAVQPTNLVYYAAMEDNYVDLISVNVFALTGALDTIPHPPAVDLDSSDEVDSGDGDAEEDDTGGNFDKGKNDVKIKANPVANARFNVGFWFADVAVPQGANVLTAYIVLQSSNLLYDDMASKIYGEDIDNSLNFLAKANIHSRHKTIAMVEWDVDAAGTSTLFSPDISTIAQEIVDRPGFVEGNAMMILLFGKGTVAKEFRAKAFEGLSGAQAKLYITYQEEIPPVAGNNFPSTIKIAISISA